MRTRAAWNIIDEKTTGPPCTWYTSCTSFSYNEVSKECRATPWLVADGGPRLLPSANDRLYELANIVFSV